FAPFDILERPLAGTAASLHAVLIPASTADRDTHWIDRQRTILSKEQNTFDENQHQQTKNEEMQKRGGGEGQRELVVRRVALPEALLGKFGQALALRGLGFGGGKCVRCHGSTWW